MFSNSLGLAQISSRFLYGRSRSTDAAIIGRGSLPVSATRPAKTDTQAAGPSARQVDTSRTCCKVIRAVTFTFTPARARRRNSPYEGSRRVLVIGIFT